MTTLNELSRNEGSISSRPQSTFDRWEEGGRGKKKGKRNQRRGREEDWVVGLGNRLRQQ